MSTGLFTHRGHNQGRAFKVHRATVQCLTMDDFADRLSEHGDVARSAREIGVSASYGRVLFARIRKKLGWQAI